MARGLVVAVLAVPLAALIVRNATVAAFSETDPESAAQIWPGHPAVEMSQGMIAIATAARDRRPVKPAILSSVYDASRKDPLAPEPFLVRGVEAQLAGNPALARQAFAAAERRDPRSLPARYFLADDAFRRGDAASGLREVVILARLAPYGAASLAPYLATYALDRSNWPQLRNVFRSNPELATATLATLARNPAHADVALALADASQRTPRNTWIPTLLSGLVEAGQYQKARAVWAEVSHVRLNPQTLIFDPRFSRSDVPAPFNWALTSSTVGLAERQPGGGLHVIYYGQEDGILASQLLILSPGGYRLTMRTSGDMSAAQPLQWKLICANTKGEIAAAPFTAVANRGWNFTVGTECGAQQLELFGASSDLPRQVDVTVNQLALARERSGG
jgi:hypothetical protein